MLSNDGSVVHGATCELGLATFPQICHKHGHQSDGTFSLAWNLSSQQDSVEQTETAPCLH